MTRTILVVDDDADLRSLIVDGLKQSGFDAHGVPDGQGTRTLLKHRPVDLALVDMRLGDHEHGVTVVTDIMTHSASTRVMMMSAANAVDEVLHCLRHGACDFMMKPFTMETLTTRIEVNLRRPQFAMSPELLSEHLIASLWDNVRHDSPKTRGLRLEQLLIQIVTAVPQFRNVQSNIRTAVEEIDISFLNDAESNFWQSAGPEILIECKNWSSTAAGIGEYDHFANVLRRSRFARTGLFVSYSGFSREFQEARRTNPASDVLIVPVDRPDLERLVQASDRLITFESLIRQAGH